MASEIATARGVYRFTAAAPLEYTDSSVVLTLTMERADGIERVVTRCRIARELVGEALEADAIIERLKAWLARALRPRARPRSRPSEVNGASMNRRFRKADRRLF